MTITPPMVDTPGRGAWSLKGGLLPLTPTNARAYGYYRLAAAGEAPVGSDWVRTPTLATPSEHAVQLGVTAIQRLAGISGPAADGWFGKATAAAVKAMQTRLQVKADGIVGASTMRAALTPLIAQAASDHDVPMAILGGLCLHESGLDPGAVGINGYDHGIAQINLAATSYGTTIAIEDAMRPQFALAFTANGLATVRDQWTGHTTADPMDIAVAHHNSPKAAAAWARAGHPVADPHRLFPIEDYVAAVRTAW